MYPDENLAEMLIYYVSKKKKGNVSPRKKNGFTFH